MLLHGAYSLCHRCASQHSQPALYPEERERKSLMYANADFGLRLYSRKVLIQQRNKDLLPEYLRFIEGVVDLEDLPLNVSRRNGAEQPRAAPHEDRADGRVHKELKTLSEGDADKYTKFWEELGVFIKEGVATDFTSQSELVDLLRFRSSHTGELDIAQELYREDSGRTEQNLLRAGRRFQICRPQPTSRLLPRQRH